MNSIQIAQFGQRADSATVSVPDFDAADSERSTWLSHPAIRPQRSLSADCWTHW